MFISFSSCALRSGEIVMFTPSASSTSAAPHFDEAARFPCFATATPRRRRDERRRRRDIEGVRVVSARADYLERVYVVQQPDAVLAHADRRGGYLVRRLALQRERSEVGRHLHAARLPVHYLVHDLARLRKGQVLFLRKLYYRLFNHLYFLPAFAASIKFFTIAAPSGVITDSGWNCTPQTSRRTSSSAIISPSSGARRNAQRWRQALLGRPRANGSAPREIRSSCP